MTALGQSRRFDCRPATSGLPLETDIVPTPEMAKVAPNKKPPEGGSSIQTC